MLDPSAASVFVPEAAGPAVEEIETVLRDVSARVHVAGAGVTGGLPDERNLPVVSRLLAAAGL